MHSLQSLAKVLQQKYPRVPRQYVEDAAATAIAIVTTKIIQNLIKRPDDTFIYSLKTATRLLWKEINRSRRVILFEDLPDISKYSELGQPDLMGIESAFEYLAMLPMRDKYLLELHYSEGRTFDSIAKEKHRTPAAIRKQAQRAIKKLQKILNVERSSCHK